MREFFFASLNNNATTFTHDNDLCLCNSFLFFSFCDRVFFLLTNHLRRGRRRTRPLQRRVQRERPVRVCVREKHKKFKKKQKFVEKSERYSPHHHHHHQTQKQQERQNEGKRKREKSIISVSLIVVDRAPPTTRDKRSDSTTRERRTRFAQQQNLKINTHIKNVFEARRPTIDVFVGGFTPNANSRAGERNSIPAERFSRTEKRKREIIGHG